MDRCSLGIVGSYKHFEIAFRYKNIDFSDKKENFNVSEKFIPYLSDLFKQHSITINDLDFIALDQGPGAFTSLRATIASCNGLSFASNVPLIGIDGLDALSREVFDKNLEFIKSLYKNSQTAFSQPDRPEPIEGCDRPPFICFDHAQHERVGNLNFQVSSKSYEKIILIALLNAYNNDVYYAINEIVIKDSNAELVLLEPKSYRNINEFLEYIALRYNSEKFLFFGNGFTLHKNLILEKFQGKIIDNVFGAEVCSAKFVLNLGQKSFEKGENLSRKLLPLYLKTQQFKVQVKSL